LKIGGLAKKNDLRIPYKKMVSLSIVSLSISVEETIGFDEVEAA